jgi:hypothetical protein
MTLPHISSLAYSIPLLQHLSPSLAFSISSYSDCLIVLPHPNSGGGQRIERRRRELHGEQGEYHNGNAAQRNSQNNGRGMINFL